MKVNPQVRAKLTEIGSMIRAARERADISQAILAKRIGMYRENLIRIEKGRANVTVETLMSIATGLNLMLKVRYSVPSRTKRPSSKKAATAPARPKESARRASTKRPSRNK